MVDTPPSPIRSGAHTTTNDSNTYTNNPNYPNNPPNNAHTHTHTHVPRVLSLNNMSQKNNLPSPPQLPNPNLWLPLSDDADPIGNYGLAFSSSNPSSDGDYPIARSISPPLFLRPQHKSLGKPPRIVTESLLRDYSQPKSLDSAEARMKDCEGSISNPKPSIPLSGIGAILNNPTSHRQPPHHQKVPSGPLPQTFSLPRGHQRPHSPSFSLTSNTSNNSNENNRNRNHSDITSDSGALTPPTPLMTNNVPSSGYTFVAGHGVSRDPSYSPPPSSPSSPSNLSAKNSFSKNKSRNERRAAHARAVVEDLKESCVRLAVAEQKNDDVNLISSAISTHLSSLPLRYALSIENPSEVLVHMRLMTSARKNPAHSAIHIQPLDPLALTNAFSTLHLSDEWNKAGLSLRLVTVSCADSYGLLEYITRVLSTGSSRVLDADVMLSSDNIALDRFVVNYNGRLRLDKLQEMICDFLEGGDVTKEQNEEENTTAATAAAIQTYDSKEQQQQQQQPRPPENQKSRKRQPLKVNVQLQPSPPMSPMPSPQHTPNPTSALFFEAPLPPRPDSEPTLTDLSASVPLPTLLSLRSPTSNSYINTNKKNMTVHFNEIHVLETLASGQVTSIFKAVWRKERGGGTKGNKLVACKCAGLKNGKGEEKDLKDLREEGIIAAPLKHENICRLLGVADSPESHCLVYEYCAGGSLHQLLADPSKPYEYLSIALDIASGMAYLHSKNIIHRDLKSTNVLLDSNMRAKIADFGLSINCNNHGKELTAETGTYRWMAPEVIRHETYSSNADVYSFGIVLWQLVARDVPFGNLTPIQAAFAVAKEDRRPQIPPHAKPALAQLISSAWHADQSCRPSFLLLVQSLASLIRDSFDPANVTLKTVALAESALSNVVGNSTVNVDAGVSLVDDQLSHR
ncbi:hypothetical protein TrST_g5911 [Triparma strigata]|uniref:Uncharacterized protein n=1 Tax=Triparma strigata TaxID=1606541 RepID=A0A9W7ASK2_9STRA|nr:hypothetical protein TrST_g5911 [Triparma strigata]